VKRLLITGGAGYLGARLAPLAARRGWEVCVTTHSRPAAAGARTRRVDLTDAQAVADTFGVERPDAIIHTACSNRTPANIAAIAPAARYVAVAAREHGARLVHVSTDLVFDGEHAPYDDDAAPHPIMPYGAAKAEAEGIVAKLAPAAVIARPSLIWSLDPLDHQTGWLVEGARRGERVTLFTDEIRCPVHRDDLAEALLELAARPEISGLLNVVGAQALSRWDLGLRLLRALGLPRGPNVRPGLTTDSGLVRPRDLTLHARRAARELRTRLRGVDEVLEAAEQRARRARVCEG
jgi:dTDP-4-dehydrorhamnose reductase